MKVIEGQNIFDICSQEFGDLELIFTDILIPNDLNLNSDLSGGQELRINTVGKGDEDLKDYIKLNQLTFNNRSIEGELITASQIAIQWPIYVDLAEAINLNKVIQI